MEAGLVERVYRVNDAKRTAGQSERRSCLNIWRLSAAAVLLAAAPAWADLSTKTLSQTDLTIHYQATPGGPVETYVLGSFDVTLEDYVHPTSLYQAARMRAVFNVNTGAGAPPSSLFDHIQLHWYQQVNSLPTSEYVSYRSGNVNPGRLPITDPPNGGWDYMYQDPIGRTNPVPGYVPFIDNDPFYYTRNTEQNYMDYTYTRLATPGVQYVIGDIPGDRYDPGGKGVDFMTYLVAEVSGSAGDILGLLPGQMLVLGGFEWHNESSDIGIDQSFVGAPAGSVESINLALNHADFPAWNPTTYTGWEAIGAANLMLATVPEPATLGMVGVAGVLLLRRSRR